MEIVIPKEEVLARTATVSERLRRTVYELTLRALRAARYVGRTVEVREHPFSPAHLMTGVAITELAIYEVERGYTVIADVSVKSAAGNTAYGVGVAHKGRSDEYNPQVGAMIALRRALGVAFSALAQKEYPGPKRPAGKKFDRENPVDFIQLVNTADWECTEMLDRKDIS